MKTLVITVVSAAILTLANPGFAMGKKNGECHRNMEKRLDRMEKILDLTDAQKQQFQAIKAKYKPNKDAHKAFQKAMVSLDPGAGDYNVQLDEYAAKAADHAKTRVLNRGQMKAEIYAVLTPAQIQTLEEHRAKRLAKLSH